MSHQAINLMSQLSNILRGNPTVNKEENYFIEKILAKNRMGLEIKKIYFCICDNYLENEKILVYSIDDHKHAGMIQAMLNMNKKQFDRFIKNCVKKYEKGDHQIIKEDTPDFISFIKNLFYIDIPEDAIFNNILYENIKSSYCNYIQDLAPVNRADMMIVGIGNETIKDKSICLGFERFNKFEYCPMNMYLLDHKRLISKNCWVCGRDEKCLTCSNCKLARYCTKECQLTALKSYHKKCCPKLINII